MRRFLATSTLLLGLAGISSAGDRVYLSFGVNLGYPSCPERRVVYVDRGPEVIVVKPAPVYYYAPYERVLIVEKHKPKHWKKHHRWDW